MSDATSSDPRSSVADGADPFEVVHLGRALTSYLRSSESRPGGIVPAQGATDLEIQLYNLIHGTGKIDPNRPNHYHLAQRWGHELFDSIGQIHSALIDIMSGSGCSPRWTKTGSVVTRISIRSANPEVPYIAAVLSVFR
jgi:hypothetical protein